MLLLEINGSVYENATSIRVYRSLYNFLGQFDAYTTANENDALPVKVGDVVRVLADRSPIFNGYIESIGVRYDNGSHEISISGRDKTCDVLDSTVFGQKTYKGAINLKSVAEKVLLNNGISGISVLDQSLTNVYDFKSGERIQAEVGQTIYEFLDKYARKIQVVMTTNEDGNIVFYRGSAEDSGLNLKFGENILSASFSKKNSDRFNKYIARSQLDPLSNQSLSADDIVNQTGQTAVDSEIRQGRILEFNTEEEMNNDLSFDRAAFEANIRRANSINYSCVVQGHSVNGSIFKVNSLAYVSDDFCKIASKMLIHSVEYSYSLGSGSRTKLEMTYKDAFTLDAQQKQRDQARQSVGDEF